MLLRFNELLVFFFFLSLELLFCQIGLFLFRVYQALQVCCFIISRFWVVPNVAFILNTKLLIQIFILLVLGIWLLIRSTSFGIYFELLGNWFPGKLVLRLEWKIYFFLLWGQFQCNKFMAGGGNGSF